jgi:hypothetical protein
MVEFLSRNIEMELEMINAPQRIAVSSGIDTTWFAEEFPGMGAAMGLALQALGLARVEMSLLPEALQAQRRAAARRVLFGVAAAAVLGLVGYLYIDAQSAGGEVEELIKRMQACLVEVNKQQKLVLEQGKNVKPRAEQLDRWGRIGSERGEYSEALEKLLAVVDDYNRKLPPAPPPPPLKEKGDAYLDGRPGEIRLVTFYMSWENPLAARLDMGTFSDQELRSKAGKQLKEKMYVTAKFECRGGDFGPAVDFEKALRAVPGFKTVRAEPKAKWQVGALKEERLGYFDWGKKPEDSGRVNGVVFWEVWRFEPGAGGVAAGAAEKAPG